MNKPRCTLILLLTLFPALPLGSYARSAPVKANIAQESNGSLDPSFGVGGKRLTTLSQYDDRATALAVQADGKIIVAGWSDGNISSDVAVLRYTTNGNLDPTFGGDGIVLTDFGGDDQAHTVVVQPNGSIVVAGWTDRDGSRDFAVARYSSNGTLDTTFDGDGQATLNFFAGSSADSFGSDEEVSALVLQSDGKLVLAGTVVRCGTEDCDADFGLARYLPNGRLDATFDGDGKLTANIGGTLDEAAALVLQPDNKLVVAGSSESAFALVRYQPNGSVDASFDGDGKVTTPFAASEAAAAALTIQPDGKLIAAGRTTDSGDIAVVRYLPNGSLDTSFDGDGRVRTNIGGDEHAYAVAVQPNGKIVLVGTSDALRTRDAVLARYQPNGSLDATLDGDGWAITDFGGVDQAAALALQGDGKLVIVGFTRRAGFDDIALARYGSSSAAWTTYLPHVLSQRAAPSQPTLQQ